MKDIQILMHSLYTLLGNKVYLRDLETLLKEKLTNLSPHEKQTLLLLAQGIINETNTKSAA